VRAGFIGVIPRKCKPGSERSDAAADTAKTPRGKEVQAHTEDPEADDGGQACGDQPLAGEVLCPSRHQIEERGIQVRASDQYRSPGGVKCRQPAKVNSAELVVPEGFKRRTQERIGEVEQRNQQKPDDNPRAMAAIGRRLMNSRTFR
jgi:hypothetical protein